MKPRISLDVEGVLAQTHRRFLEVYNRRHKTKYQYSDIDNWDWVRDEVDYDEFMMISDVEWRDRPLSIHPTESSEAFSDAVERMSESCVVDIVTARTGVQDGMEEWLNHHGITDYQDYRAVSPTTSKAKLGYDFYIDDRPRLAEELDDGQTQIMIMKPYNQDYLDHPNVIPVRNVSGAVYRLSEMGL